MLSLLAQTLSLGKDILRQMQLGNWQQASELQQQQQIILNKIDKADTPKDKIQLDEVKQLSVQIQALTDQQLKISHSRKDQLLTEIKSSNKSKKMHQAYNQNN